MGGDPTVVDALDELLASPGWAIVRERLNTEIERRRDQLERLEHVERTAGAIGGLRLALQLPEALRAEEQAQITRGKKA